MEQQYYGNHVRKVPKAYYAGILMLLLVMLSAITFSCAYTTALGGWLLPISVVCLSLAGLFMAAFTRTFALKVQDRAIRAEEGLRHFILTGKPIDPALTLSQIIALRFASDDELAALAERATKEKLSNKQIKEAIKHWKADHHRV